MLKISIAETSTDIKADILKDLVSEVEGTTDGRIKFEIYYSNELGSLSDVTEQMAMGGNILAGTSGDFYATYGSPDIMATALQYALPTPEAVQKFNDSPLFKKMADDIEKNFWPENALHELGCSPAKCDVHQADHQCRWVEELEDPRPRRCCCIFLPGTGLCNRVHALQ